MNEEPGCREEKNQDAKNQRKDTKEIQRKNQINSKL